MKIEYAQGAFILRPDNSFDKREAKRKGFTHNPLDNTYITNSLRIATRLRRYFNEDAKNFIKLISLEKTPWPGSDAFPVPKGKKLDPHQVEGVKFILERNHSYIAFEQRLGKTPTSIVAMNAITDRLGWARTIIIAPPFVVTNWFREIREWQTTPYEITVLRSQADLETASPDFDVLIVADSIFAEKAVQRFIRSYLYDFCIVDEGHRFNVIESQRTHALYGRDRIGGVVHLADRVTMLSGTPMRNRPYCLFPVLSTLAANVIGYSSKFKYAYRFCGGKIITRKFYKRGQGEVTRKTFEAKGASNVDELQERLEDFMLVKKLKDHITVREREQIVSIDSKRPKKVIEFGEALFKKYTLEELTGGQNLGDIAKHRRELSELKFPIVSEYLDNAIDNSDHMFMVFGIHTDLLESLAHHLRRHNPILITGKVRMDEREKMRLQFQAKRRRVVVANIFTMVGADYSAANRNIFVESSWTWADNEQAKYRAFGRQQEREVVTEHLVLANTLDEYVMRNVIAKKNITNKVIKTKG